MKSLIRQLRDSFDLSRRLDAWFADVIEEPREEPLPLIVSDMISHQDDKTLSVYTASHIIGFAAYMPRLADFLKNHTIDAGYAYCSAEAFRDSATMVLIEENPPVNYILDKNIVVNLMELAHFVTSAADELHDIHGLAETAQMFLQNFKIARVNPASSDPNSASLEPKGYK